MGPDCRDSGFRCRSVPGYAGVDLSCAGGSGQSRRCPGKVRGRESEVSRGVLSPRHCVFRNREKAPGRNLSDEGSGPGQGPPRSKRYPQAAGRFGPKANRTTRGASLASRATARPWCHGGYRGVLPRWGFSENSVAQGPPSGPVNFLRSFMIADLAILKSRAMPFSSIPEAIEEFRAGRMLMVVDDEDRENEGDL